MMFFRSWLVAILLVAFAEEHLANPSINLKIDNDKFIDSLTNNKDLSKALKVYNESLIADVNDIANFLLRQLNWFLFINNKTSFDIEGTKFVILGNGLELSEGKLNGIDSLVRKGNATLKYDYPRLSVQFVIGFVDLTFQYRYYIKTWFGGLTGIITVTTEGNRIAGDVTFDTTNLKCTNAKIKMKTLGDVDILLKEGILDFFVHEVMNIAVDLVQAFITDFVNDSVEGVVQKAVKSYNDAMCNLSGNCI